jgi:hypothetical protein
LPPALALITQHYQAVNARDAAAAHLKALRSLQSRTEQIERLEEAIWAGRGADDWVIAELERLGSAEGTSKVAQAVQVRI